MAWFRPKQRLKVQPRMIAVAWKSGRRVGSRWLRGLWNSKGVKEGQREDNVLLSWCLREISYRPSDVSAESVLYPLNLSSSDHRDHPVSYQILSVVTGSIVFYRTSFGLRVNEEYGDVCDVTRPAIEYFCGWYANASYLNNVSELDNIRAVVLS